jgi:DNA polymerase-3 subunit alpha
MDIVGFEPLHVHSDFSLLDGFGMVEEYSARWKSYGGNYLCISDHGMMAAIPRQIKTCEPSRKKDDPHKNKRLQPIFACELYVNPMQIEYSTDAELQAYIKSLDPPNLAIMRKRGYHLLAIAYNDIGYSNLVKLTSTAWTKGFYYRPRCNHEQLKKYKEGIIFTSCCYASEVGQAFDRGGEEAGFEMIEKYIEMFGRENYYLEIMLLDFVKQKPYNKFIIKAHEKYGLRIILTNDTHYCNPEDSKFQRYMLMIQTGNTVKEIQRKLTEEGLQDMFELQDTNLWLKTEEELNAKWASDFQSGPFAIDYEIFKQAKMNTVEICKRAAGVRLDRSMKLPQIENADQKLKDYVCEGFKKRHLPSKGREGLKYIERIKEEYSLICHKDFSSYFLIQKEMTDEARRICRKIYGWNGREAVGPGRGSAAGSLICYCLGITDVDPLRHDLLFSRFLSETRGGKSIKLFFDIDPISVGEAA